MIIFEKNGHRNYIQEMVQMVVFTESLRTATWAENSLLVDLKKFLFQEYLMYDQLFRLWLAMIHIFPMK